MRSLGANVVAIHANDFRQTSADKRAAIMPAGGPIRTTLNGAVLGGGRYSAGEDVGSLGELVADDVRVHPHCGRGIGMAEPGGDHLRVLWPSGA
jgi:hypothetical protein